MKYILMKNLGCAAEGACQASARHCGKRFHLTLLSDCIELLGTD